MVPYWLYCVLMGTMQGGPILATNLIVSELIVISVLSDLQAAVALCCRTLLYNYIGYGMLMR